MPQPKTAPDRILVAKLSGTALRHSRYRELTEQETAVAVAELRSITARPDLLAEVAGVLLGAHSLEPEHPELLAAAGALGLKPADVVEAHRLRAEFHHHAAHLLISAGADETALERWVEVGRERAAAPRPGDGLARRA